MNDSPPRLTDKEKDELRAEGKCFRCKEPGHMSRDCPDGRVMIAKGNKPPGVASYNIELRNTDELRDLAETTETIDDLHVGVVDIQIIEEVFPKEGEGFSMEPRYCIGDFAAKRAMTVLEVMRPYPGDGEESLGEDENRFHIYQIEGGQHVIMDQQVCADELIETHLLFDPMFNLPKWYAERRSKVTKVEIPVDHPWMEGPEMGKVLEWGILQTLQQSERQYPWTTNDIPVEERWTVTASGDQFLIWDRSLMYGISLARAYVLEFDFDLISWYRDSLREQMRRQSLVDGSESGSEDDFASDLDCDATPNSRTEVSDTWTGGRVGDYAHQPLTSLPIAGVQIPRGTLAALQRNAAIPKDFTRVVPKPVVVVVHINGHPARALLDSGSLGDFVSTSLVDQLKLTKVKLKKPLALQLAVQGSCSKVNWGVHGEFRYQGISGKRYFDVANLSNYDLILGTPWLFQHRVTVGLNPACVVVGSDEPLPIRGDDVARIASRAVELLEENLEKARAELVEYARDLCKELDETDLPPFRAINHEIPLIDENKIYPWRPSRCPEVFRQQWAEKKNAYLRSGRWRVSSARNTVPMMFIAKPGKKVGSVPELRTVVDLRARNANTMKMSSPLPDIDGVLRRVAGARYRSLLDLKNAYEQIRIIPEHVDRSAVTTPDGNMVSLVVQMGDCNAPATYQALMNHIFSPYIGRILDVYLDDIIVYSNTFSEHMEHVKLVIDILQREKLYLSLKKLHFLQSELKLLGRIVGNDGIRMDPEKVESVLAWKTPTNRDLLRGFLGAVGYLADDLAEVRIPMAVLHGLTGDTVPFRWEYTHQRAFEDVKGIVNRGRHSKRVPIRYRSGAEPIFLITDGCATGVAGVVAQGPDWKSARVAAFYSAKLNSAQQNYPVHEIEMLAGVETMLRHRDILQGAKFIWITDHKGLIHLLKQKDLSGRQARWMEKISEFNFEVEYAPGVENVLADALSRMYSNDAPGTVRARSEYTYHDVIDNDVLLTHRISMPILTGLEAAAVTLGAESGRPETSREFAARMRNFFVLKGPRERKEGEDRDKKLTIKIPARKSAEVPKETEDTSRETEVPEVPETEKVAVDVPVEETAKEPEQNMAKLDTSLLGVVSGGRDGIDLSAVLRNKYSQDLFFKTILENPKHYRNFEVDEGLIYLKVNGGKVLCIPKILEDGRNVREFVIEEAHSVLAHLGTTKTLTYLREYVWWKTISARHG